MHRIVAVSLVLSMNGMVIIERSPCWNPNSNGIFSLPTRELCEDETVIDCCIEIAKKINVQIGKDDLVESGFYFDDNEPKEIILAFKPKSFTLKRPFSNYYWAPLSN